MTANLIDPGKVEEEVISVGRPLPGFNVLLLDEEGHSLDGEGVGEMTIKSRYLSPGYWRRPDLTQIVFTDDPAGGGERFFKTGGSGPPGEPMAVSSIWGERIFGSR